MKFTIKVRVSPAWPLSRNGFDMDIETDKNTEAIIKDIEERLSSYRKENKNGKL